MAQKTFDIQITNSVALAHSGYLMLWIFHGMPELSYDPVPGSNPLRVRVHGQIPVYIIYLDTSMGLQLQVETVLVDETVIIAGQHYRPGMTVIGNVVWIHLVEIEPVYDPSHLVIIGVMFQMNLRVSIRV